MFLPRAVYNSHISSVSRKLDLRYRLNSQGKTTTTWSLEIKLFFAFHCFVLPEGNFALGLIYCRWCVKKHEKSIWKQFSCLVSVMVFINDDWNRSLPSLTEAVKILLRSFSGSGGHFRRQQSSVDIQSSLLAPFLGHRCSWLNPCLTLLT